jgi:hypothetical protein
VRKLRFLEKVDEELDERSKPCTRSAMSVRPATLQRIEDAHRFGAFYPRYLANHLPMALVALDHMAPDDARLARFEREPVKTHLEPIGSHPASMAAVAQVSARIAKEGPRRGAGRGAGAACAGHRRGGLPRRHPHAYARWNAEKRAREAHALAYWSPRSIRLPEPPRIPAAVARRSGTRCAHPHVREAALPRQPTSPSA